MFEVPAISYRLDDGTPIYSITDNEQAYWWGMNCQNVGLGFQSVVHLVENHEPELTREQQDELLRGYMYKERQHDDEGRIAYR